MPDMIRNGAAWLAAQLTDHASEPVVYCRGGETATMQATLGSKLLRIEDADGGLRVEWTDLDMVVPAADLTLGGAAIEPKRGDVIRVADPDGSVRIYEVAPVGGDPAWRWTDPFKTSARIHAKYVETEHPC